MKGNHLKHSNVLLFPTNILSRTLVECSDRSWGGFTTSPANLWLEVGQKTRAQDTCATWYKKKQQICGLVQKRGTPRKFQRITVCNYFPLCEITILLGYHIFMLRPSAEVAVLVLISCGKMQLCLCGTVGENSWAYLLLGEGSVMRSCRQYVRSTCQISSWMNE